MHDVRDEEEEAKDPNEKKECSFRLPCCCLRNIPHSHVLHREEDANRSLQQTHTPAGSVQPSSNYRVMTKFSLTYGCTGVARRRGVGISCNFGMEMNEARVCARGNTRVPRAVVR